MIAASRRRNVSGPTELDSARKFIQVRDTTITVGPMSTRKTIGWLKNLSIGKTTYFAHPFIQSYQNQLYNNDQLYRTPL